MEGLEVVPPPDYSCIPGLQEGGVHWGGEGGGGDEEEVERVLQAGMAQVGGPGCACLSTTLRQTRHATQPGKMSLATWNT